MSDPNGNLERALEAIVKVQKKIAKLSTAVRKRQRAN
jgi:hypothetical protein